MSLLNDSSSKTLVGQGAPAPPIPLNFREKMFAGAIARGVAQSVLHPVDVVRTRLQARNVVKSWKLGVFIKGVIPQIALAIPAGAVQFVAFEAAKDKLSKLITDDRFSQARTLFAGAFGAFAAASFRIPQEVLKQRIQADIYPNVLVALKETVGKQGLGSLYKGSLATISRDVPWNALSFMFHAQAKSIFRSVKGRAPENDENLALAGVSGAIAAIIMTPVDVVKTRIMTGTASSGIIGTLNTIVKEEGAGTLMKGVLPRIVFLAPLAGITFSVYEAVAANIRKRKNPLNNPIAGLFARPFSTLSANTNAHNSRIDPFASTHNFSKNSVKWASSVSRRAPRGSYLGDYDTAAMRIGFTVRA